MADKQPTESKPKKRLIKNPETFRERAIKASEGSDKPSRISKVKAGTSKAAKPVFRPIGKAGKAVADFGPLQFLRKPLRIIGRVLVPHYLRNSWKELRLVTWPSFRVARKLTVAVIIFATIFGLIVAGVDFLLDRLFRDILLK